MARYLMFEGAIGNLRMFIYHFLFLLQITGQSGQHGQSVKGQVHNIVFVTVKYYFQWVSSVRRTAVRAEPALIPISFQVCMLAKCRQEEVTLVFH